MPIITTISIIVDHPELPPAACIKTLKNIILKLYKLVYFEFTSALIVSTRELGTALVNNVIAERLDTLEAITAMVQGRMARV